MSGRAVSGDPEVRAVAGGEWEIVAWLWQCFRNDLAGIVSSFPRADGRYPTARLDDHRSPGGAGYLAWTPHSETGDLVPFGFALVQGLLGERRSLSALWVAPVVRRGGLGRRLALEVIGNHPGPWAIAFQHENALAAGFWRGVADEAFGAGGWHEDERPVPGKPDVPSDHWIVTRSVP